MSLEGIDSIVEGATCLHAVHKAKAVYIWDKAVHSHNLMTLF